MKTCKKCKTEKELTEFHKDKTTKDGLRSSCKPCRSAQAKQWYANNSERAKAVQAAWKKANPEKNREITAAWKKANPCHQAAWAKANPEKSAYLAQKSSAVRRGIEFNLSFDEWLSWWGDDFEKRGRDPNALCMCRYDDCGNYEITNIYKATTSENCRGARSKQ